MPINKRLDTGHPKTPSYITNCAAKVTDYISLKYNLSKELLRMYIRKVHLEPSITCTASLTNSFKVTHSVK